jgi:hypothetical protein
MADTRAVRTEILKETHLVGKMGVKMVVWKAASKADLKVIERAVRRDVKTAVL